MQHRTGRSVLLFVLLVFSAHGAHAQEPPTSVTDSNSTGAKPFGSYLGSEIDYVDLLNGGLNVKIPIPLRSGRAGLSLPLNITYNSIHYYVGNRMIGGEPVPVWKTSKERNGTLGWRVASPWLTVAKSQYCGLQWRESGFVFHDSEGTRHAFENSTNTNCAPAQGNFLRNLYQQLHHGIDAAADYLGRSNTVYQRLPRGPDNSTHRSPAIYEPPKNNPN